MEHSRFPTIRTAVPLGNISPALKEHAVPQPQWYAIHCRAYTFSFKLQLVELPAAQHVRVRALSCAPCKPDAMARASQSVKSKIQSQSQIALSAVPARDSGAR